MTHAHHCPIMQLPICSRCKVTTCVWNTDSPKYHLGCIFGKQLSDKLLSEAKGISLLRMEQLRKYGNERIQKAVLLYSYLAYIEQQNDYVRIPVKLLEGTDYLDKIMRVLSKWPFNYDSSNHWNISNFLAAVSNERYDNFYIDKGVSRKIYLHRLFNTNQYQMDKLFGIKRHIGIILRNNEV